jgi:hypothetical protein
MPLGRDLVMRLAAVLNLHGKSALMLFAGQAGFGFAAPMPY